MMVRVPVQFVWEHESMKEQKAALVKVLGITSVHAKKAWKDLPDDKKKIIEDGYNNYVFVKDVGNKLVAHKREFNASVNLTKPEVKTETPKSTPKKK